MLTLANKCTRIKAAVAAAAQQELGTGSISEPFRSNLKDPRTAAQCSPTGTHEPFDADRIGEKIRIQPIQVRESSHALFDPVAEATLSGRLLQMDYEGRSSKQSSTRLTHPQRLIHYRSNWYLAAFCESADALRLFSIDRIREPKVLDKPCRQLEATDVEQFLTSDFGIFGGAANRTARLRFSPEAAKWVAEERWHPQQRSEWLAGGYYLSLPYSETPELAMDILRYGADVEVLSPPELREEVAAKVRDLHALYW